MNSKNNWKLEDMSTHNKFYTCLGMSIKKENAYVLNSQKWWLVFISLLKHL